MDSKCFPCSQPEMVVSGSVLTERFSWEICGHCGNGAIESLLCEISDALRLKLALREQKYPVAYFKSRADMHSHVGIIPSLAN